jgi:hypothetical protein
MAKKESKLRWWIEVIALVVAPFIVVLMNNLLRPEYSVLLTNTLSISSSHFLLMSLFQWSVWMFFVFVLWASNLLAFWLLINCYIFQFIGGAFLILTTGVLVLSFMKPGEFSLQQQFLFGTLDLISIVLIVVGVKWRERSLLRQAKKKK